MTENYFSELYVKLDRLNALTSALYMSEEDKRNISGERMQIYREVKKELTAVRDILIRNA